MANIPCPNPCVECAPSIGRGVGPIDPDFPVVNLTSEGPDIDVFFARSSKYGGGGPPLGGYFYQIGCLGVCVSNISQQEANLCAAAQEVLCLSNNWPNGNPGTPPIPDPPVGPPTTPPTPRPVFGNFAQSCSFTCADGTPFNFVVPSGKFFGFSQAEADQAAYTYACAQAARTLICIGTLTPARTCASSPYVGTVSVTSLDVPVTITMIGDLPDGLLLSQSVDSLTAVISGTPTTPGDYVFTLVATDASGRSSQKELSISVFGISTDSSLPGATKDEVYLQQLDYGGTASGIVEWTVVGALPDGLTLNPVSGIISGTPTSTGEFDFVVTVSDSSLSCSKRLFMTVEEAVIPTCPDWTQLAWTAPVINTSGGGTASFTPSGANGDTFILSCSSPPVGANGSVSTFGDITYNGPGCNCALDITVAFVSPGNPPRGVFVDSNFSGNLLTVLSGDLTNGVHHFTFAIPDTLGNNTSIQVSVIGQVNSPIGGGTLDMTGQMTNV